MRTIGILGVLMVSTLVGQNQQPPAVELFHKLEAGYVATLRGTEETITAVPSQPQGREASPAPAGAVSVAQLRHKPSRSVRRAVDRAAGFSQAGDHRRAAEELEKAVASDPAFADAHYRLGVEYLRSMRYAEAGAELQRSLALDPYPWQGYYALGVVMYLTGDLSGAERSGRRALELSKTNVQVHLLLGLLLWSHEESKAEALEHFKYAARGSSEAKDFLVGLEQP